MNYIQECPVCGRNNYQVETFRCKCCGKYGLCLDHFDKQYNVCKQCADYIRIDASLERYQQEQELKGIMVKSKQREKNTLRIWASVFVIIGLSLVTFGELNSIATRISVFLFSLSVWLLIKSFD